jgi:hypothetical protein
MDYKNIFLHEPELLPRGIAQVHAEKGLDFFKIALDSVIVLRATLTASRTGTTSWSTSTLTVDRLADLEERLLQRFTG